jgi:hypothetical protein
MTSLSQIIAETSVGDALEEEIKGIISFSLNCKVSLQEILDMPSARFEYLHKLVSDEIATQNNANDLLKTIKEQGNIMGR